jgi:hypothetical protein
MGVSVLVAEICRELCARSTKGKAGNSAHKMFAAL